MKDRWILALLALGSIALFVVLLWPLRERIFSGVNDFMAFYAGAHLLDTGDLYDNAKLHQASQEHAGDFSPEHGYIRLPFHAAFLWPLSRLPYRVAYPIWEVLLIGAFAGFVALWRPPRLMLTMAFSAMCLPAVVAIINGQDDTFLLLFMALAVYFHRKGNDFGAGLVFSLCAIKFHLFLLTPVLIVGLGAWRFARGFLAGGGVLALISFAVAGLSWPVKFFESILQPEFSPLAGSMPNLHGPLSGLPYGWMIEIVIGATIVAACWIVARRAPFTTALACCSAGGLLLSYHAYLQDASVLLPAALAAASTARLVLLRVVAVVLLIPPTHFVFVLGLPASGVVVGLIVVFVWLMAVDAWRGGLREGAVVGPATPAPVL